MDIFRKLNFWQRSYHLHYHLATSYGIEKIRLSCFTPPEPEAPDVLLDYLTNNFPNLLSSEGNAQFRHLTIKPPVEKKINS